MIHQHFSRSGGCTLKTCVDALRGIFSKLKKCVCSVTSPEKTEQEGEEEELAASQVNVLSWVSGCVCFSSWNAQMSICKSFSAPNFSSQSFVTILFFPISSYNSEDLPFRLLPCVPEPFLHCLLPWFLCSMMNSQHELVTWNCSKYSFCERSAWGVTPILTPTRMWFGVGILGTLGNAVMTAPVCNLDI